jgi:hypothetical protein
MLDNMSEKKLEERKIRYQIAEEIFDEILKADLHQSEIARHLLIPITFLTGAATFLFKFLLDHNISFLWADINLIPVFFLLYIFFTVGGIFVFFEIIGPSFYMKKWPSPKKGPKGPRSTLFFKLISRTDSIEEWVDYFYKKKDEVPKHFLEVAELQDKLVYDFAVESFQLAKKAHHKSKRNLIAHMFFYPSFCSLLLMAFLGIVSLLGIRNFVSVFAVAIVAVFVTLELKVIQKYVIT